jgi:RNA polymerase sigma-70 factor (ECF subfamily)
MSLFSPRRRRPPLTVVRDAPTPERTLSERALDHVDELYSLAYHLCGNASDAEDLVQDTYARALAGSSRFDGANLRAWLYRILRNAFIDHARRRKIVLEIPDDTLEARAAEPWDNGALAPLRYLTMSEVAGAIATLPVELRLVVLLDVEGFSEAEIADIAHCAAGTVKSRLSRARARLRAALKEDR